MKHLRIFILGLCLSFASQTFAGTVGSTIDLESDGENAWLFSFENDIVFERELESDSGNIVDQSIDSAYFGSIKATYMEFENLKPFIKIGSGFGEGSATNDTGNTVEYESELGFYWGVGIEGIIKRWEETNTQAFYSVQFDGFHSGIDSVKEDGLDVDFSDDEFSYLSWQLSLGVSRTYEIGDNSKLTPYAGLEYRDLHFEAEYTASASLLNTEANSANPWGVFAGLNYDINDTFRLGIEGRYGDENAISLSGSWKF